MYSGKVVEIPVESLAEIWWKFRWGICDAGSRSTSNSSPWVQATRNKHPPPHTPTFHTHTPTFRTHTHTPTFHTDTHRRFTHTHIPTLRTHTPTFHTHTQSVCTPVPPTCNTSCTYASLSSAGSSGTETVPSACARGSRRASCFDSASFVFAASGAPWVGDMMRKADSSGWEADVKLKANWGGKGREVTGEGGTWCGRLPVAGGNLMRS